MDNIIGNELTIESMREFHNMIEDQKDSITKLNLNLEYSI